MATRGRKPKPTTETTPNPAASLLTTLSFLKPAAAHDGPANQTHCNLRNGQATMFDGLAAFGVLTPGLNVHCNPHLMMLLSALERCQQAPDISHNERGLYIRAGKFNCYVPCLPDDLFAPVVPANPVAPLSDTFKTSLEIVGRIAVESAPRLVLASVMARNGSAVATDGKIMFEHWHGHNVPEMTLPKTAVAKLCKIAKPLISFGATFDANNRTNQVTFWFDDNSWFRTQLYVESWPSIDQVLEVQAKLWPVPIGLWEGLKAVADFTDEFDRVHLRSKQITTHADFANAGAVYEIEGSLPENLIMTHAYLTMFEGLATHVDWNATEDMVKFQGENFRGCLMKVRARDTSAT